MRLTRLALAAALVVASAPARAEDGEWLTFMEPPFAGATVAVHTGRLIEKGGRVTAWLSWTTSQGSFVEKREVDCAKNRSRELSTESNVPNGAWKEAPPDSVIAGVVRFLCDHPPFSGWAQDPASEEWERGKRLVARAIRRGDVVTRWEAETVTLQLVEYDCKRGSARTLYMAIRPRSGAGDRRAEEGYETHSILSQGLRMAVRLSGKEWRSSSSAARVCEATAKAH